MVGFEPVDHGTQAAWDLRDVLGLLGRQLVEVLVDRGRRLDLVRGSAAARYMTDTSLAMDGGCSLRVVDGG